MSLRSLFRQSALYTVGNVAPKIGAFLLLPLYVRFLTQAEYGALALLTSLAGILAIVYHLGLDGSLMRLHFDVQGAAQARLYTTATLFSIGLGIVLTILLALGLGPFFESLFADVPFIPLGGLALLVAMMGSLQYVPSTLFRASGQAGRFLVINVGSFVVSSLTSVVLVVVFGLGAAGVLAGQLTGSVMVFVIALVVVGRLGPWTVDRKQLSDALALGLPLLPHGIAAWALRLADRWLIALLIGLPAIDARAQVGIYAVGYQLGFIVSIAITSFNAAWSPYFYRIGLRPSGPAFYTQMTSVVIGGLLALAAGASALAEEIVAIIARPGYERAADVLPVIAFASVCQGLYTMFVTVVFLTKRTRRLPALTLASAAINIGLNVVLIPRVGILGAAWATLVSYAFFAAAVFWYARASYSMKIDWVRILAMAIVAVSAASTARLIPLDTSIVSALARAAIAGGAAVAIGLIAWQPVQRLRAVSRAMPADG